MEDEEDDVRPTMVHGPSLEVLRPVMTATGPPQADEQEEERMSADEEAPGQPRWSFEHLSAASNAHQRNVAASYSSIEMSNASAVGANYPPGSVGSV
eukprot:Trichotokara_eunicae@DN4781_c0_g2_i2.p1